MQNGEASRAATPRTRAPLSHGVVPRPRRRQRGSQLPVDPRLTPWVVLAARRPPLSDSTGAVASLGPVLSELGAPEPSSGFPGFRIVRCAHAGWSVNAVAFSDQDSTSSVLFLDVWNVARETMRFQTRQQMSDSPVSAAVHQSSRSDTEVFL